MYLPRFDPWEIYLALYLLFCHHYFVSKWFLSTLIYSITLFWQLKFWVGFWTGNRRSNRATLAALLQACIIRQEEVRLRFKMLYRIFISKITLVRPGSSVLHVNRQDCDLMQVPFYLTQRINVIWCLEVGICDLLCEIQAKVSKYHYEISITLI